MAAEDKPDEARESEDEEEDASKLNWLETQDPSLLISGGENGDLVLYSTKRNAPAPSELQKLPGLISLLPFPGIANQAFPLTS